MSKTQLHEHCDELWHCRIKIESAIKELRDNHPIKSYIYLTETLPLFDKLQVVFREEALRQDKEQKGLHPNTSEMQK